MVSGIAFHPREAIPTHLEAQNGPIRDGTFEVAGDDIVSYRFYGPPQDVEVRAVLYYFHGNAEVCTVIDDVAEVFHRSGAAVLSIDYRGYAWGTGRPSLTKLCRDAEECFCQSRPILSAAGYDAAKVIVMGRSIGATCAVHLAAGQSDKIHGLIVDNGLMSIKQLPMVTQMAPLLFGPQASQLLQMLPEPFDTIGKLPYVSCPTLVMHAEKDEIVPVAQGKLCHERVGADQKVIHLWPEASHNDVCNHYLSQWSAALTDLIQMASGFESVGSSPITPPAVASLPIAACDFYAEYHGHPLGQLETLINALRQKDGDIVWLAGDSSLDNKHWLFAGGNKRDPRHLDNEDLTADAVNGYEELLSPARMVRDVAFWLNSLFASSGASLCCVNTAVEESTLADRRDGLKPHDELICNNLKPSDVIVISVGGNDVALRPSAATQMAMMQLMMAPPGSPEFSQAHGHIVNMFKDQTEEYIKRLVKNSKVRAVVVCMIYYFDETPGNGWCEGVLSQLRYNQMPGLIQGLINMTFEAATARVAVPGITIIPLQLSAALDGKTPGDYCQRVEPSVAGGRKMANLIAEAIDKSAH